MVVGDVLAMQQLVKLEKNVWGYCPNPYTKFLYSRKNSGNIGTIVD